MSNATDGTRELAEDAAVRFASRAGTFTTQSYRDAVRERYGTLLTDADVRRVLEGRPDVVERSGELWKLRADNS